MCESVDDILKAVLKNADILFFNVDKNGYIKGESVPIKNIIELTTDIPVIINLSGEIDLFEYYLHDNIQICSSDRNIIKDLYMSKCPLKIGLIEENKIYFTLDDFYSNFVIKDYCDEEMYNLLKNNFGKDFMIYYKSCIKCV